MEKVEFVYQYVLTKSTATDPRWCPNREQVLKWMDDALFIYAILEGRR